MESLSVYSFVSEFFHSTLCLWDLFILLHGIINCLFSLLYSIPLYECTTVYLSTFVSEHLGGFQFGTVLNKAVINILVHVFGGHICLFLLQGGDLVSDAKFQVGNWASVIKSESWFLPWDPEVVHVSKGWNSNLRFCAFPTSKWKPIPAWFRKGARRGSGALTTYEVLIC